MSRKRMDLPPLFSTVRVLAEVSAFVGVAFGLRWTVAALEVLDMDFWIGAMALWPGLGLIAGSISGLGMTYATLAAIEAVIDIRNETLFPDRGGLAPGHTRRIEPTLEKATD